MLEQGVSPPSDPVFFLDAFTRKQGFALRTTAALKAANFKVLYMANPDKGIHKAALAQGVTSFHGSWLEAAAEWEEQGLQLSGFYLDVCSGRWSYVKQQLLRAMELAAPKCVLAITILPRDYDGLLQLERSFHINDFFGKRGWVPGKGAGNQHASTILYKATDADGGHRQTVYTQVWARV
jgi:hypothetical protein